MRVRRMKILYHHRTYAQDGARVHIEELIAALRDLGNDVIVVGPANDDTASYQERAGGLGQRARAALPRFAHELLEFLYAFHAYRRLKAAVSRHRPDVLYERYNLFLPSGIWLKRRYGLPMLLEVNAPLAEERRTHGGLALQRLARWTEASTWCGADRVLPVTEVLADHVRNVGVPDDRIVVIPNGVDARTYDEQAPGEEAKERLGLSGRLILGFTGFVRPWHGLDRVVEFVAKYDGDETPHLLLVGDGPERGHLEERARTLGVADRLTVTGVVRREEVPGYVAAFDVALQPDATAYASPLKLVEYLASGKAIIAPAQPNLLEVLQDGRNAVLFDKRDEEGLTAALKRVCADPDLRLRLGAAARATIEERGLTWHNNAKRVMTLFQGLLAGRDDVTATTPGGSDRGGQKP
jgi:glycosyltransferase involved in cell wall biosynthesis